MGPGIPFNHFSELFNHSLFLGMRRNPFGFSCVVDLKLIVSGPAFMKVSVPDPTLKVTTYCGEINSKMYGF